MNIIVVDTESDRRRNVSTILRSLCHTIFEHAGAGWIDNPLPGEVDACFFHVGDSGNWEKLKGIPGITRRLFWYSGVGVESVPPSPGLGHPIRLPIRATMKLNSSLFEELLTVSGATDDDGPAFSSNEERKAAGGQIVSPPRYEPQPAAPPLGGKHGNGQPRFLQDRVPSVLVALSILCEGFLIATAADGEKVRNLPEGAKSNVLSRDWWRRPFGPVLKSLDSLARREWGASKPDSSVLAFVSWISGAKDLPEDLDRLVPKVRNAINNRLS